MKRIICIVAAALLGLSLSAQSFTSDFTQTRENPASGRKITKTGTMEFTAPDQLAMIYSKPDGEYMIIDGPLVRMEMDGQTGDIDSSKNPRVGGLRATLLNCILGDWEKAAKDNDAESSVKKAGGLKTVTLTARKAATRGYSSIVIVYREKDSMVTSITLEQFSGIKDTYTLTNIKSK